MINDTMEDDNPQAASVDYQPTGPNIVWHNYKNQSELEYKTEHYPTSVQSSLNINLDDRLRDDLSHAQSKRS